MPIKLHRDQFRWTNGRGHGQKPVLYSQKANQYGLGKKEHNVDDWWAKAFDNQLKSLDVSNSSTGEVTVKQTKMAANPIGMHIASRYYIKFVSGGILKGDVETAREEAAAAAVVEERKSGEKKDKKARKENDKKAWKEKEKKARKGREKKGSRSSRESTADGGKRKEKKSKVDAMRNERKEKRRLKRLLEKEMALLQMTPTEA